MVYVSDSSVLIVEAEPVINTVITTEEVLSQVPADVDAAIIYTDNESILITEAEPVVEVISVSEEATIIETITAGPQGPAGRDGVIKEYVRVIDESSIADVVFVGEADFGTSIEDAAWRIYKADFTSGVSKTWANGNTEFVNKWTERLSLIYN